LRRGQKSEFISQNYLKILYLRNKENFFLIKGVLPKSWIIKKVVHFKKIN